MYSNHDIESMLEYMPLADVLRVASHETPERIPDTERSPVTGDEPTIPAPKAVR